MNPRLQAYLLQCINHDEVTVDQSVLQQSPDAAIERLRMDYHDRRQKAWEMGASYLDYKSWLEEHVIRQQDFAANVQDDCDQWKARAEKAEADYAKLCNAVVGANCHVDHAIETMSEERAQATMMYSALAAIEYGNELDWLKAHPNVRTTFDASSRRVAAIARAIAFLREGGE